MVWERVHRLGNDAPLSQPMIEIMSEDAARKLARKGMLIRIDAGGVLFEKGLAERDIFEIIDCRFEIRDGDRVLRMVGQET